MNENKGIGAPTDSDKSYLPGQPSQFSGNKEGIPDAACDEPYNPVRGEIALWNAVITQALLDARITAKNNEERHVKWKALYWLTGRDRDFSMVCDFAGHDADCLREKIKPALARGCKWRAEPKSPKIISHHRKKQKTGALGLDPSVHEKKMDPRVEPEDAK